MSSLWDRLWPNEDINNNVDAQRNTTRFACNELSPESFLDLPPDSFWVPKSHERDWVDHHALTQRRSSMKLSFIGKSKSKKNSAVNSNSFSQRFSPSPSQKSKATSFIGLPMTQKSCFLDGYDRQRKGGISPRLFRSRSEPGGRLVLPDVPEPSSPKVSCMGRVKPQKGKAKRPGFWMSFKSIVRIGFGSNVLANRGSINNIIR